MPQKSIENIFKTPPNPDLKNKILWHISFRCVVIENKLVKFKSPLHPPSIGYAYLLQTSHRRWKRSDLPEGQLQLTTRSTPTPTEQSETPVPGVK